MNAYATKEIAIATANRAAEVTENPFTPCSLEEMEKMTELVDQWHFAAKQLEENVAMGLGAIGCEYTYAAAIYAYFRNIAKRFAARVNPCYLSEDELADCGYELAQWEAGQGFNAQHVYNAANKGKPTAERVEVAHVVAAYRTACLAIKWEHETFKREERASEWEYAARNHMG